MFGLAYTPIENSEIIFPVGYIMNDEMTYYIADLIQRYPHQKIVLGRQADNKMSKIKSPSIGVSQLYREIRE